TYNALTEENIDKIINEAIDSLPNRCREIFIMSRMDLLKYREIAAQLNISINTVENQMSIALHKLKIKLKNYITLFIILFSLL
ncbi:MAG TPA: sigma-70 family RNA polymerase sigma factor, partial [Bacteroidales bacterium]